MANSLPTYKRVDHKKLRYQAENYSPTYTQIDLHVSIYGILLLQMEHVHIKFHILNFLPIYSNLKG